MRRKMTHSDTSGIAISVTCLVLAACYIAVALLVRGCNRTAFEQQDGGAGITNLAAPSPVIDIGVRGDVSRTRLAMETRPRASSANPLGRRYNELVSKPVSNPALAPLEVSKRQGRVVGSANGSAPSPVTFTANVSAFCPKKCCCGVYSDGITASGHVIMPGDKFVAAPPKYPFGTMIDVPGYGRVPVLDRGGAIKGNKLDVYFDTHEAALQWGRQYLDVTVN